MVELLTQLGLAIVLVLVLLYGLVMGAAWVMNWWMERRENKRQRVERELDRRQEELRGRILDLAEALNADAHEVRKAMIRESFLASGQVPPRD